MMDFWFIWPQICLAYEALKKIHLKCFQKQKEVQNMSIVSNNKLISISLL